MYSIVTILFSLEEDIRSVELTAIQQTLKISKIAKKRSYFKTLRFSSFLEDFAIFCFFLLPFLEEPFCSGDFPLWGWAGRTSAILFATIYSHASKIIHLKWLQIYLMNYTIYDYVIYRMNAKLFKKYRQYFPMHTGPCIFRHHKIEHNKYIRKYKTYFSNYAPKAVLIKK